jgi:hypothetical protein
MANQTLVKLYQKNKNTFIVATLMLAIGYLATEVISKQKVINDKDKYIKELEQKHTKFLTDWINRHDRVEQIKDSLINKNN